MQSDETKELYDALAKAQGAIEGAAKTSENPHFRSKYADLGAVWDACRKPLSENGLSVLQMPRTFDGEMRLVTRLAHASGQYIEDDGFPLILSKQDMQSLGSATTYARRYGLMSAIGIAPEDDDGNSAVGETRGAGKPVQAKGRANGNNDAKKEKATAFLTARLDELIKCTSSASVDDIYDSNEESFKRLAAYDDLMQTWVDAKQQAIQRIVHDQPEPTE